MSATNTSSRLGLKVGLVLGVLVVAGIVAFYSFRSTAQVVLVKRDLAVDARPGSVTVAAESVMDLKSQIGGRIIKSDLDEGKHVTEGEFLVQLDTGDVDLEIEKLQNDYATLQARIAVGSQIKLDLVNAQVDLANDQRLNKLGQVSNADVEKQSRFVEQVQQKVDLEKVANDSELKADLNTIKVKQREKDKMTITAPVDSVISVVMERRGALINPGSPIATLISTKRTIEARISEEEFTGIQVGQKASVRFLSYGTQLYGASVTKVLPTADPATQRYIVYLNVDLPLAKLTPGLTGEVSIVVGERPKALIVPRRAVFSDQVYVVKGGQIELRPVKLGYRSLIVVEVLDGLGEGEQVIAEDIDNFSPGQHVRTEVLPK